MPAALPLKDPVKVGQLLRRRLRELKRTPRELAEAVQVTEDYMADLVSGRRRPPPLARVTLKPPWTRSRGRPRTTRPSAAAPSGPPPTPRDCDEFLRPRITTWDIDLDTHAMRIVLR